LAEITPKVAEIFPNWPNFTRIGAQKISHGSNFGQLERYSTKIGGENKTVRSTVLERFLAKNFRV
jgi:hypothetical protein